jgi:hypothetical protein|tara:strand:- start:2781 stop:3122 length:342 start_codon:yes stop_codon:yes gene_type:complete
VTGSQTSVGCGKRSFDHPTLLDEGDDDIPIFEISPSTLNEIIDLSVQRLGYRYVSPALRSTRGNLNPSLTVPFVFGSMTFRPSDLNISVCLNSSDENANSLALTVLDIFQDLR